MNSHSCSLFVNITPNEFVLPTVAVGKTCCLLTTRRDEVITYITGRPRPCRSENSGLSGRVKNKGLQRSLRSLGEGVKPL